MTLRLARTLFLAPALAAAAHLLPAAPAAQAATILALPTPAPAPGSDIGARIRWGATGAEAGLLDNGALIAPKSLNPVGTPAWTVGQAYAFEITWRGATGTLALALDFNRDGDFLDAQESTATSVFAAAGPTSYAGLGFGYLSISLSQDTPTASLSGLTINGTAIGGFAGAPASFTETWFGAAGTPIIGDWTITGSVTFHAAGNAQERPAFNFRFRQPGEPAPAGAGSAAVPAPAGLAVLGVALLGLAAVRRRG